jgi:hypothetical protein
MDVDYRVLFACASQACRKEVRGMNCLCPNVLGDAFVDVYGHFGICSFQVHKVESAVPRVIRLRVEGISPRFLDCDHVVRFSLWSSSNAARTLFLDLFTLYCRMRSAGFPPTARML